MCKIRFPKYVNNLLNILGRDVFIVKNLSGEQTIKFQGKKIRYSGYYPPISPLTKFFDVVDSSPDEVSEYVIPTIELHPTITTQIVCYNTVYLKVNDKVYIDRR